MKKILLVILATVAFVGCSNNEKEPELIDFSLDYRFWESGSMSRSGADLYNSFYDKYIKTKILTPTSYSLNFLNTQTQASVEVSGKWGAKDMVRLLEGEYKVNGKSKPNEYYGLNIDTISVYFDELINLNNSTNAITLQAKHDSYLLLFDAENIRYANYNFGSGTPLILPNIDNVYYIFIRSLYGSSYNFLDLERKDGKTTRIYLDNIPFEKGKYYYFNDITESFEIPKMEPGN